MDSTTNPPPDCENSVIDDLTAPRTIQAVLTVGVAAAISMMLMGNPVPDTLQVIMAALIGFYVDIPALSKK